jgi:hypothetical protein
MDNMCAPFLIKNHCKATRGLSNAAAGPASITRMRAAIGEMLIRL